MLDLKEKGMSYQQSILTFSRYVDENVSAFNGLDIKYQDICLMFNRKKYLFGK